MSLDLYVVVKRRWKKKYVDDPGVRRGARLKFRIQTRSAGLRAEVGGCKNWNQSSQRIMCCSREDENVEHILAKCEAYGVERAQL